MISKLQKCRLAWHSKQSNGVRYKKSSFDSFLFDEVDSVSAEKTCLSHLSKLSTEWLQTCSSSKEL